MVDDLVLNLTTTAIDTLLLQLIYLKMKGGHGVGSRAWVMLGEIIRLAQAVCIYSLLASPFHSDIRAVRITVGSVSR
jgi:hypothetical protein